MNIAKALVHKNKLVAKLNNTYSKIQKNNSTIVGTVVAYDVRKLLSDAGALTEELVRLKTALHVASAPVRDKIFELSEIKSSVKMIQAISTSAGPIRDHYARTEGALEYVAVIGEVEKESLITDAETEIEALQEALDQFNHTTEVTW